VAHQLVLQQVQQLTCVEAQGSWCAAALK